MKKQRSQNTGNGARLPQIRERRASSDRDPAQVPEPVEDLYPLPRSFYARDTVTVARECIGALLVSRKQGRLLVGRIVEAEAYRGPEDRAAHSYGNRRTRRTEVMFGPAGHAYVFLLYGMHHNFNVVTGRAGEPQAVLIRALEPVIGTAHMAEARGVPPTKRELTNGPGKLCRALDLDLSDYARDLTNGAVFLARGSRVRTASSARIGIDYAGAWARKPWRFFEPGNRYVSGPASLNLGSRAWSRDSAQHPVR